MTVGVTQESTKPKTVQVNRTTQIRRTNEIVKSRKGKDEFQSLAEIHGKSIIKGLGLFTVQ